MKVQQLILLFIVLLIVALSCSTGPDFERDNEKDPKSREFIPDISSFEVELNNDKTVSLRWTDNSGFENGFVIAKTMGEQGEVEILDTLSANSISYTDDSKLLDVPTTYHVGAYKEGTNSADSIKFISRELDFGEFTNVSAEASIGNHIAVNWQSDIPFADKIVIKRRTHLSEEIIAIDTIAGNKTSFTFTEAEETYSINVYVHALLKNTAGYYVEIGNANISNISINLPSELKIDVIDEETINVTWQDNSSFNEQFIVYQREAEGQNRVGNDPFEAIDTLSKPGRTSIAYSKESYYEFTISPYRNDVEENKIKSFIVILHTISPKFNKIESISENEIILHWNDRNVDYRREFRYPTKRFVIERSINAGDFDHYASLDNTESSIHVEDLDPNLIYTFRIRSLSSGYGQTQISFSKSIVEENEFNINSWDSPRTLRSTPLGTYFVYEYSHSAGSYGLKLLDPEDGSLIQHLYFDSDFRGFSFSPEEKYVAIFSGSKAGVYEYEKSYEIPIKSYNEEASGVFISNEEIIISNKTNLKKLNIADNTENILPGFEEILTEKPHFWITEVYPYKTATKIFFYTSEGLMAYDFVENELNSIGENYYKLTDSNSDGEILIVDDRKVTLLNDEGNILQEFNKPENIDDYYLEFINAKFAFGSYVVIGTNGGILLLFNKETGEYNSYHQISNSFEPLYVDTNPLAVSADENRILVFLRNQDGMSKFFTSTEGWTTISYEQ